MPPLHGTAAWSANPGLPVVSASYTCAHGVTPGVATLVVPMVDRRAIGAVGSLTLSDGLNKPVTIPDCRVTDTAETDLPGGTRGLSLTVVDTRHRWKYGSVSGAHNVIDRHPDPDVIPEGEFVVRGGIFVPGTERTPSQLIRTCFGLLNVPVAFAGIPDGERPPVNWQADNPARAADRVAEAVGCRLIYQPLAGRVLVTPPGADVRGLNRVWPILNEQPVYDTADRPSHVEIACGDTLVTDIVALRSVGWEEDGRLRPIEELSYAPADGWWNWMPDLEGWWQAVRLGDCSSIEVARALARQFVWKLFRAEALPVDRPVRGRKANPRGKFFEPPVFGKVRNRKAITLSDRRVYPERDASGQYVTKPAIALTNGVNWKKDRAGRFQNFTFFDDPKVPFAVDAEAGLVTFSRHMYRIREKVPATGDDVQRQIDDALYGPPTPGRIQYLLADIYLHCSYRVRNGATWQYYGERVVRQIAAPAGGVTVESHRRTDLQRIVSVTRALAELKRSSVADNLAEVRRKAGVAIAAAAVKHLPRERFTRTYAGILRVDPDAGIQSVTWAIGDGPPTTRIGVNTETEAYLPSFAEKRKNERSLDFLTDDWVRQVLELGPPLE